MDVYTAASPPSRIWLPSPPRRRLLPLVDLSTSSYTIAKLRYLIFAKEAFYGFL